MKKPGREYEIYLSGNVYVTLKTKGYDLKPEKLMKDLQNLTGLFFNQ